MGKCTFMPSLMSFTSLFFFFLKVLHLRCPTFKVSILEETKRFGNVSLKLNVTSSKNENGEYATDGRDTVSLEGRWCWKGGGKAWAGEDSSHHGPTVGLILCSAPRSLHPLLCCLHLHAPPPERSGLSFLYTSKRLTASIFWEL